MNLMTSSWRAATERRWRTLVHVDVATTLSVACACAWAVDMVMLYLGEGGCTKGGASVIVWQPGRKWRQVL